MPRVLLTDSAQKEFAALPLTVRARVVGVFERLRLWPEVSGAKGLTGILSGNFRIRTGDWRVVFRLNDGDVVVWKIGHRKDVYYE